MISSRVWASKHCRSSTSITNSKLERKNIESYIAVTRVILM